MGVTIRVTKNKFHSIDLSYFGFAKLRRKVAELSGEPWASHYAMLEDTPPEQKTDAFCEAFDTRTQSMLDKHKVAPCIVDFCLQPDCKGRIRPYACRHILNVIRNYDDGICYGYAARKDCAMFQDFKDILQDCVDKNSCMAWQ